MTFWKNESQEQKTDQWLPRAENQWRGLATKGHWRKIRNDETLLYLDCGGTGYIIMHLSKLIELCPKMAHIIACKLYFNKPSWKKI